VRLLVPRTNPGREVGAVADSNPNGIPRAKRYDLKSLEEEFYKRKHKQQGMRIGQFTNERATSKLAEK
jgi:hypothetical protein